MNSDTTTLEASIQEAPASSESQLSKSDLQAAQELARRLVERPNSKDQIVLFLGAGCSRSSGIPLASELASTWLERCQSNEHYTLWRNNPSQYYGLIFDSAFKEYNERRNEISKIMRYARPAYGYYVLAKLLERDANGANSFRTILTTNFDDLLEQALTIHTHLRPQVIAFAENKGETSSVVSKIKDWLSIVKLHGDYRSATLNGHKEIEQHTKYFDGAVGSAIKNSTMVFIGYGGNDPGIASMFKRLNKNGHAPSNVYWVGNGIDSAVCKTFKNSQIHHININDFDGFMNMVLQCGKLPHLSLHRLSEFSEDYISYLIETESAYGASNPTGDWSHFVLNALSSDPQVGKNLMEKGYKQYPSCAAMLSAYAHYHKDKLDDYPTAMDFYQKALEIDKNHWRTHVHLATYWRDTTDRDLPEANKHCELASAIFDGDNNTKVIHFGILVALSETHKAQQLAEHLRSVPMTSENSLEFHFYNAFLDGTGASLQRVRDAVNKGGRTPDCEYKFILESDIGKKHQDHTELMELSGRMSK